MHVAVQVEAVHLVMQPLDLGDLAITDILAGEPAGQRLQAAHHIEQFGEVALAQLPDARTAVRQELDQPFRRQHFQRLAERRARDAQHLAELPLRNAATVGNVALDEVVAQPGQNLVMQRLILALGTGGEDRLRGGFTGNQRFHGPIYALSAAWRARIIVGNMWVAGRKIECNNLLASQQGGGRDAASGTSFPPDSRSKSGA